VLHFTPAINEVERRLENALVAVIRGTRPASTPDQVATTSRMPSMSKEKQSMLRYKFGSFLVLFSDRSTSTISCMLTPPPTTTTMRLHFNYWCFQARAIFSPLHYKVLLVIENMLAHVWSWGVAQSIISSSCLIFDTLLGMVSRSDMSILLATAWAIHPNLILVEVGCVMPEPENQPKVRIPVLFLCYNEII
jgi:hypothetical protein